MTGENLIANEPQPGGRDPAPGALAVVQAFVNTHYDMLAEHGGEVLTTPPVLRAWLNERQLIAAGAPVTPSDLDRALVVREGLRALARANNGQPLRQDDVAAMNAASARSRIGIRLSPSGPELSEPVARDVSELIGSMLAIAGRSMIDGSWPRLKACAKPSCGWCFFDHSKNMSGRWCSMKVCGDREKARAYYERQTAGE